MQLDDSTDNQTFRATPYSELCPAMSSSDDSAVCPRSLSLCNSMVVLHCPLSVASSRANGWRPKSGVAHTQEEGCEVRLFWKEASV